MDIEIDKNKEENIISSQNVINKVLSCIGISRERTSTYTNYSFDGGELLRLRVSDHGLFLQYWYDKNREARMSGENIPKLNIGQNLAITFSLTATECAERNIPYPQKIANKTAVKTEQGNNAKPQFTVRHICYFTDKLEEADINSIINELKKTISDGSIFEEPLHDSQKVAEWNDTSNCQPQKVQGDKHNSNKSNTNENMNKNRIRLTESQLHRVIKESVKNILSEMSSNGMRAHGNNTYVGRFTEKYVTPLYRAIDRAIQENNIHALFECYDRITKLLADKYVKYDASFIDLCKELKEKRHFIDSEILRLTHQ